MRVRSGNLFDACACRRADCSLMTQNMGKEKFVATAAIYFSCLNLIKVPVYRHVDMGYVCVVDIACSGHRTQRSTGIVDSQTRQRDTFRDVHLCDDHDV